jgi:hypothetical protein
MTVAFVEGLAAATAQDVILWKVGASKRLRFVGARQAIREVVDVNRARQATAGGERRSALAAHRSLADDHAVLLTAETRDD